MYSCFHTFLIFRCRSLPVSIWDWDVNPEPVQQVAPLLGFPVFHSYFSGVVCVSIIWVISIQTECYLIMLWEKEAERERQNAVRWTVNVKLKNKVKKTECTVNVILWGKCGDKEPAVQCIHHTIDYYENLMVAFRWQVKWSA